MLSLLKEGSYWEYKGVTYRIIRLEEEGLSQDALGDWVPTVVYEVEGLTEKHFYRPYTDFLSKFQMR